MNAPSRDIILHPSGWKIEHLPEMQLRTYPFYVGGPKNMEPIMAVPDGMRIIKVPVEEPYSFDDPDRIISDFAPYSEHIYHLERLILIGHSYLQAWISDGLTTENATDIVWKTMLNYMGCFNG